MKRLERLIGVIVALGGFAAAHVLVQVGNAQVPPLPTVTATTAVPVPTVTAPVPVPPTPTVTSPTVPVPAPPPPPTPTVTVPTVPPPPTVTVPPAPTPPPAPKPAPPPAPKPPPAPSVPAVPPTTAPVPVAPAVPTVTTPTVAAPSAGAPPSSGTSSRDPGSHAASGSSTGQAPAGSGPLPTPGGSSVVVIRGAPSSAAGSPSPLGVSPYDATTAAASGTAATRRAVLGARKLEGKRVRTKGRVKVRLDFSISRAARLFLIVRGPFPSCRVAGYIPIKGHKGKNTVIFAGRAQGHALAPGVYLLSLSTTRRFTPGAPSEYVRVFSPRRAVPLPDSASKPSCAEATAAATSFTTTWVSLVRAMPPTATTAATPGSKRPTAQIASAQKNDSLGQDAAGLLPSPDGGALAGVTSSANEHPFAAIAVLALVAALLFAMVTLVTRFLRGSWNP
jgi:hypothetical protein